MRLYVYRTPHDGSNALILTDDGGTMMELFTGLKMGITPRRESLDKQVVLVEDQVMTVSNEDVSLEDDGGTMNLVRQVEPEFVMERAADKDGKLPAALAIMLRKHFGISEAA